MGERHREAIGLCLRAAVCAAVVCVVSHSTLAAGPEPELPSTSAGSNESERPPTATGTERARDEPIAETERRSLGRPSVESQPLRSARGEPRAGTLEGVRTVAVLGGVVAVILGLAIGVRVLAKRHGGLLGACGPGGRAPAGVLSVVGRYPIARGQTLLLLQLDRRIVLVGQTTGRGGARLATLAEITDPEDVASILVKARDESGESVSNKFREIVDGLEGEPAEQGRAVTVVAPITKADWFETGTTKRSAGRARSVGVAGQEHQNRVDVAAPVRQPRPDGATALRSRLEAMRTEVVR